MAENRVKESFQPTQADVTEHQRSDNIAGFAKHLHATANSVAQALLPVIHLCRVPSVTQATRELLQKTFALAAILSTLVDDLALECVSRGKSQDKDMWTTAHYINVLQSMNQCACVFEAISRAVRTADEDFHAKASGAGKIYDFVLSDERQELDTIDRCFYHMTQTRLVVRHTVLTRVQNPNDEEIQNTFLLTKSLQQQDSDELKNEPLVSKQLSATSTATPPNATPAASPPQLDLEPNSQNLTLADDSKSVQAFSSAQHLAYVAASARENKHGKNTDTRDVDPPMTLHGSTSKETPEPTEANRPTDNTPKAEPGCVTFGQPSIIKPLYSTNPLFGTNTSRDPVSTCKSSGFNFNTVTPIPHLEAYIVRPMMQSTDAACTLSFGIESLRLSEHVLQAKVQNLGPDYSIMDELLDLQPQMLNLIQSRTAQRQGNIVSVEYGKSVELTTLIGSLQFKPAVFIISTTTVLPQNPLPNPTPTCTPLKFESKQNGNPGLFNNIAPAFGFASTNLSPATVTRHHPSAAEAYSTRLQEQGESCTHVESSEGMGLAHYQTMTTNKSWHDKDRSLEEIRLADYEAGRNRPMKTNGISYPWDAAPAQFAPPTKVEFSKTGWFPVNIVASNPSYAFAPAAPKVEQATQNGKASPYLPSDMAPSKPSSFQELWPALPPFVPPQNAKSSSKLPSGMTTSGPGLFQRWGSLPSVPPREPFSNTVCTLQHQHGLFCRTSVSQGKASASTTAGTIPSPFASLATATPKQCHFGGAATTQTTKPPFAKRPDISNTQFGGSAPAPSGASTFLNNNDANSNTKQPSDRPAGCSSCNPTPSCALFGGNTSQPVTQQRSLFETSGTAPDSPPRQALFGGTTGQPVTQQRNLFGNLTTAPAPPLFGGMAAKSGTAGPPA